MNKLILSLTVFLLCFSIESHAQFYIGGGIGNSFINKTLTDLNGDDFKIDKTIYRNSCLVQLSILVVVSNNAC